MCVRTIADLSYLWNYVQSLISVEVVDSRFLPLRHFGNLTRFFSLVSPQILVDLSKVEKNNGHSSVLPANVGKSFGTELLAATCSLLLRCYLRCQLLQRRQ